MAFLTPLSNRTWFNFEILNADPGLKNLAVYEFSGTEEANRPYEFSVELVKKDSNFNLTGALGKDALLTIADRSGGKRFMHGVIRETEQLHTANSFTHYRCIVVPRLWFLNQTQEQRIYQHQTVEEIIQSVLQRHTFVGGSYSFKLSGNYPVREYCVQYGESDLHFIDRLSEEEGLTYYFEHSENNHCLYFVDAAGGPAIPGDNTIMFFPGSGKNPDTTVISRLHQKHRINSDSTTYKEWNFTTPAVDLTSDEREKEWDKAPAPKAMTLETYKFPHLYQEKNEGDRYANIQLLRQLTFRQWIECESDVTRFVPGYTFNAFGHPRADNNRGWWVVSVHHHGEQPGVLEHEAPDNRGITYNASVKALPDDVRFVPPLAHPKVRIEGLQSAIVTGPAGEEVYTDRYGRVKVQFHWDRLGQHNENTTCWVRVSDSWAGVNFGFIQIPRIGQEVMVEFMEGDPDRPVITGRTYNANHMPPWQLPEQKTVSGIQSREFKNVRRNQMVLDDTSGEIQAQLSSDHDLAQLNLGYITRLNHIEGRKDFRGEGFELRTDSWGSVRAGKGLYISTHLRNKADQHQKDIKEAMKNLDTAVEQHQRQLNLAVKHGAQIHGEHAKPLSNILRQQNDELRGTGEPHSEFTSPQLLMATPVDMATTAESTHIHSLDHTAMTAGSHVSVAAGQSFLATAIERVSLFARNLGMRLFAGAGKVEIQAQTDDLDVIAQKVLQLISAKERVHISAPKEILLTAGESYIKIDASGVESGTNGKFTAHAGSHEFVGPKTKPFLIPEMNQGPTDPQARVVVIDELGRKLDLDLEAVNETQHIDAAAEEHKLQLFHTDKDAQVTPAQIRHEGSKYNVITGNSIILNADTHDDFEQQDTKA